MKALRSHRTLLLAALAALACGGPRAGASPAAKPRPTRGYVLISIDALRADALGPYGSQRPTTPFLDRLAAERATVFENAFTAIPSTLPSHMSMFTGLYASQHAVFPPSAVLAPSIPTLPELMKKAGFRTFGHSEGGFVQGGFGFARGFDEWTDTPYASDTDIERTFQRGLDSISRVAPGERFFLFLHTYSVHDPYDPPAKYRDLFWQGPPPAGAFEPTGPNFSSFNSHQLDAPPEAARYYRALYDASVRYMDDTLAHFFAELERLGVAGDTTVIFTADHGEEFLDHGRFVHTQAYPECLRVPLLIVHPDRKPGRRVAHVAETVDFLPTLADLAGFAPPAELPGESLAPLLAGPDDGRLAGRAFGQDTMLALDVRTVLLPVGGHLHQLLYTRAVQEHDGFWMPREVTFDATPPPSGALEFRAVAYHEPRVATVFADGQRAAELEIGTDWKSYRVALPAGRKTTLSIRTPRCTSPADIGLGKDRRCLSIKLDGLTLQRFELFDLALDPGARADLSLERPDLVRTLAAELRKYPERARAGARSTDLTDEQVRKLKALGYLQ